MSTRLNYDAYKKMIQENLDWLAKQPRTLERDHVEMIVKASLKHEYPAHASLQMLSDHGVNPFAIKLVHESLMRREKPLDGTVSFVFDGVLFQMTYPYPPPTNA